MPQSPEHPIEKQGPEETLEFLKRNEVRTMAKDVAQLREEQAGKEREKIMSIKPKAPVSLPTPVPAPLPVPLSSPLPAPLPAPLAAPLKKPARFDKVFIRVALILGITFILINIAAFAVWNMQKNSKAETAPALAPAPAAPEGGEPRPEDSGRAPEPSLFSLFQTLLAKEETSGLTKMLVKDKMAELPFPSQLKEIIQDEFTVFSFVSQDKKRLGFIFQLQSPQGVQEMLQQWEGNMEKDLETLWNVIGQKGKAYVPFFRQTSYQNTLIRFQTFSVKDFGIVYALKGNVLLITSSLESMKAALAP
ncbi:MAG: hypothetical protein Greene071421_384 [Parcubacteria group bacterium Greene0714_21]|nr:MAG: hypothetical protein Greene041639_37 [Parcubacteria group bacterium Greene0416_39]TSC98367.1 MAG: hypothetical protein Greene101447_110 [Parcubacteria group bacterium Greene1014_47]TSD04018.1 MAG: hypothetical protein Greene071421_384 [Parcubacteria group bacterium Greene0714_21]